MAFVALGIKRVDDDAFHIGILHRSSEIGIRFLHLANHKDLRNDFPEPEYTWIEIAIDEILARNVAARCRNIFLECGKTSIGYSFAPGTVFADDYTLSSSSNAVGFTCATFVMRLLADGGLDLIDVPSWQSRPDDLRWQMHVISMLELSGADPQHITYLRQAIGAFRFTPIDVAIAATLTAPATFQDIDPRASAMKSAL